MKRFAFTALAGLLLAGSASAEDTTLKMQTIEPSLGQAITMATFANIVTDKLDDVSIEVAGGGAATLHQMETARGNLDMYMISPTIHILMSKGAAMYKNEPEAPELAKNVQVLMWFPYGQYHFAVRGDSDITVLDDIEGATVFLGPQGGGAYNAAKGWIEATTGLAAGEDYDAIKANWATGFQSFMDGKVEMYVNGCIDPCQQFIQFTETETVRFIGPEDDQGEAVDKFLGKFRHRAEIPAGLYENQVNDGPVNSNDTAVGIGVRADLDEELVYRITKAFWENLDSITTDAPWAKALSPEYAAQTLGTARFHLGAARYYKEIGVQ
ncbi:TAXI family TRAP transporter solute-binding subunit [Stappia sp. BW2]|uniref:TAXI family TRAP transporter solute-binding subunit n=1 Tax=Stappia sp. BW2 TaxID=2592622 RepID=UPI0011DE8D16|nr:TAXI family TRAP transporter solute-binding subunit [Stappia sp. BW2]TYC65162.1 TAXI family TRAP transporter solute-binding subunit [Stappia sp. BW2]